MPKYEASCNYCGEIKDYISSIADRNTTPLCCGLSMEKGIFTAPKGYVLGRFEPFKSTVDGSIISTKRGIDEHNKRNNVISLADGYSNETLMKGEFHQKEAKLDKKELQQDIAVAYDAVKSGYKPTIEVQDGQ